MNPMQRSARQFYYEVLAPEERGMNYAQINYRWLNDTRVLEKYRHVSTFGQLQQPEVQESLERVRSFVPALSNDVLLNRIVDELIRNTDGPIQAYLKTIFVAKRNDPLENAAALVNSEEYQGDLIMFYVGLSLACHEYANLFAKFIQHKLADESDRKQKAILDELTAEAGKLFTAQTKWRAEGDQVKLDLRTILADDPMGATIAHMTDRFILCHEISHHLLGHTGKSDIASHFFEKLPAHARKWIGKSKEHARELQADALALILASGFLTPRNAHAEDQVADVALGSLLTLTVLGQASGMNTVSATHPSARDRLSQCVSIIESLQNNRMAVKMAFDMCEFHDLLEYVQDLPLRENSSPTGSLLGSLVGRIRNALSRPKR